MPPEESLYPQDWFNKARQDLQAVEMLVKDDSLAEVAGFHLQQAIEKHQLQSLFKAIDNLIQS